MKILVFLPFLSIFLVQVVLAQRSPLETAAINLQTNFTSLYRGKFNEAKARQILSPSVRFTNCATTMDIEELIVYIKEERSSGFFVDIIKDSASSPAKGKLAYTVKQWLYFGVLCIYKEIDVTASEKNGRYVIDTMKELKCQSFKI